MNAVESAPSAKRSRRRFGARNAAMKASFAVPAPNSAAKICSRANPSTRLHITANPTMPVARILAFLDGTSDGWVAGRPTDGRDGDTPGRCQNPPGSATTGTLAPLLLTTALCAGLLSGHVFIAGPASIAALFLLGSRFLFRRSFGCHISWYGSRLQPDVGKTATSSGNWLIWNRWLPGAVVP